MGFVDITFTEPEEEELKPCIKELELLCETQYPDVLEFTHHEFVEYTNITSPRLWKKFLLNKKVKEWFNVEKQLQRNAKIQHLTRIVGTNQSTATAQALNTLVQQQKADEEAQENKTVIIYNFIDLTEQEEESGVINVLKNKDIPSGIRRAVTYIPEKTDKNN